MMQTAIAKRVLDHQLHDLGLLSADQKVDDEADLIYTFRDRGFSLHYRFHSELTSLIFSVV